MVFAITLGAMAFSTYVFDTLDVAIRLGRYILQELISSESRVLAVLATLLRVEALRVMRRSLALA